MARSRFALLAFVIALTMAGGTRAFAYSQNDPTPTPTPRVGPSLSSLSLVNQSNSDDAEATIEALQTTVAEQATTIAELSSSPTPEPTPTSEPTEEPLPQVASEPVDLGSGIFLYSYLFTETDDGMYLAADLVNSSGSAIVTPGLTATYFDSDGAALGEDSLYSFVSWTDIDSHIAFNTSSVLDGAYDFDEIAKVEFSIVPDTYTDYAEVDASNLEITGAPMEGPDEGGVSGKVKNNGTEPVKEVTIIYAVYDATGVIVGSCYSYLDVSIPAGKSAKFSASSSCGNIYSAEDYSAGGKPFSYRLMISL